MGFYKNTKVRVEFWAMNNDGTTAKVSECSIFGEVAYSVKKFINSWDKAKLEDLTMETVELSLYNQSLFHQIQNNRDLVTLYIRNNKCSGEKSYKVTSLHNNLLMTGGYCLLTEGGLSLDSPPRDGISDKTPPDSDFDKVDPDPALPDDF